MQREERYFVLKKKDMARFLTEEEQSLLTRLKNKIEYSRGRNKEVTGVTCVVVEHDWPEYEPVWKMIEDRVNNTEEN